LASFMKVMKYAYFGDLREKWKAVKEVPFFMKLSMVMLSLICLVGGILVFGDILQGFLGSAQEALSRGTEYAFTVLQGIK
ncbi:MAG: hypothetical protein KKH49_01265, partial [Candidatus Omnitrophica bacterium]|nr:hypothetical protein [Candidatus Omnitrophota bacterium]